MRLILGHSVLVLCCTDAPFDFEVLKCRKDIENECWLRTSHYLSACGEAGSIWEKSF